MEETKGKEVRMAEKTKLTYEQLENLATQLSNQNQQLFKKLQEANLNNMFARLNFLFKVMENSTQFSMDFVAKCADEIEAALTIPEPKEEEKE